MVFLFMNIFIDNLLMQFFLLSKSQYEFEKNILYQYFVGFFCPAWDSFSENILYAIT